MQVESGTGSARTIPAIWRCMEVCMIFGLIRKWRRRRLLAAPEPVEWHDWLAADLPFYGQLTRDEQRRLREQTRVFLAMCMGVFTGLNVVPADHGLGLAAVAQGKLTPGSVDREHVAFRIQHRDVLGQRVQYGQKEMF